MKRLETLLVLALSASLILEGCMTDRALTREELDARRPRQDEKAFFALHGDSIVTAEPFHHLRITEPKNGLFASGDWTNELREISSDTALLVPVDIFDAIMLDIPASGSLSEYRTFRTSDSTIFEFIPEEALRVSEEDGTGYVCAGSVVTRHGRRSFSGFVRDAEIEEVRVAEYSATTTLVGVGITAAIVITVVLLFESSGFMGDWEMGCCWGW